MEPPRLLGRALVLGALLWSSSLTAAAAPWRTAVVLERDDPAARDAAIAAVARAGGRVIHAFDGLLVVEAPASRSARIERIKGLREASESALPARRARGRSDAFRLGLEAWNRILRAGAPAGDPAEPLPEDPFGGEHALIPPAAGVGSLASILASPSGRVGDGVLLDRAAAAATFDPAGTPYGAQPENTSEFLAGRVSVNVVLMESDGTIDVQSETWSAEREAAVIANVATALDWLRAREPQARLSFVYHVHPGRTDARARTGYEPIRRPADPNGTTGEALWLTQILAKLGWVSGDRIARSRAWAHATRVADATDWAVNVFVADSLADADGRFADGRFAYTWVGGPHLVMTYDNQTWGVSRFHMVFRHEFLHAFYAFDEYATSACSCSASRGYLNGPGSNCAACNASAAACVMISNGDDLCAATRRQIGWADLDGDAVADVVGQDPDTFLDAAPAVACGALQVTGTAAVVAATNLNPMTVTPRASISVARVAGVELRRAGEEWVPAEPADGVWNEPVEAFLVTLAPGTGGGELQFRARDDYASTDGTPAMLAIDVHPAVQPLPGPVLVRRRGGAVTLDWPAAPGAVSYRVFSAPAPAGAWSAVADGDELSWTDDPDASTYYRVRAVDACGNERP